MNRILITEFMDASAVDLLTGHYPTTYAPELADSQEQLPAIVSDVTAIIVRNRTIIDAPLISQAPHLKCVGRLGVGLDNIDLDACGARGIAVFPASGANNLAVAEYVITTASMMFRNAYQAKEAMLAGKWPRQQCAGREIAGKTLGLVGFGAIARDTCQMAKGLGMRVLAHDPFVPEDDVAWKLAENYSLDGLIREADVISLHIPLTASTHHLLSRREFGKMKQDTIVINAARGGVVDESALCEALTSGHLGGAALDVFENEPLDRDAARLFQGVPNLILTPHIAGVTAESNVRVSAVTAQSVLNYLQKQ